MLAFIVLTVSISACKKDPSATSVAWEDVQINQIQILGSHNSYRQMTYKPIYEILEKLKSSLPADLNPDFLNYTHLPLEQQMNDYNVRSIELDVYYDHDGGRFYNRQGLAMIDTPEPVESNIPELNAPGYKILHIPDIDYNTNYYTFKSALSTVKNWSDAHPRHLPLIIYVETKQETAGDIIPITGFVRGIPYTPQFMDELDDEIRDVFGINLDKVITPDKFRGDYSTLREAALAQNWPTLKEARGKIIFVTDGEGMAAYRAGKNTLEGRVMFVFAEPEDADAAFVIRNTPIGHEAEISDLVKKGFMVRTRADADTKAARTGDYTGANAAFASGAQIVSTDYYRPDYRCDTSAVFTCYQVQIPGGGLARISSVFSNHEAKGNIEEE